MTSTFKEDSLHRVKIGAKEVLVTEEEPLLPQLERSGLVLEYQCREGYCSSCALKLVWGKVYYPEEPMAWVQGGHVLSCCAYAKSDIEIASL
ncbi:2Fe-2S iron-sulfur cluster binding domain-containing protein [Maribrevibacterium harenarium]|uniref:2Fe-2S iron-sulfur cluster binding domain-containing protein n=1 Tax=Maribrevibacterium harenarium TaxID=2589817 RepID=A0A501X226_9GAMM|nr:class I ribonucleotide reductase maintenance protein YfaE [Maribrevibacterium harenarium]TPE54528.1 2Fe-2S iron-sulfur cluster binding domain-containing protein [Maribrevibacterium harenarium]